MVGEKLDDDRWRTPDVLAICAGIRASRDWSGVAILADALQEAGCDDEEALAFMRCGAQATDTGFALAAEAVVATAYSKETAAAVRAVRDWADNKLGEASFPYDGLIERMDYFLLMEAAHSFVRTGDDGLGSGCMDWSNASMHADTEFWPHFTAVTGLVPRDDWGDFLACTC